LRTYLDIESALRLLTGILNLEWVVFPPSNNNAAIPDDAIARAIWPSRRTIASKRLYKMVFPVPLRPSIKNRYCYTQIYRIL
jgi:hypothetical protein